MSETAESPRRRARGAGGGAARRADRTMVRHEAVKYIERNIPNFEILNEEALEIIEANAETVLAEIGVNFPSNPGALKLWADAGAEIDGERVRIPWCWPRSMARLSCATLQVAAAMPRLQISKKW
jgi:trimethylamine--corrinoid protein Co-methyltransferase